MKFAAKTASGTSKETESPILFIWKSSKYVGWLLGVLLCPFQRQVLGFRIPFNTSSASCNALVNLWCSRGQVQDQLAWQLRLAFTHRERGGTFPIKYWLW
ncbi:hypothetical protein M758_5G176800 [Ceratodon purpureus]|nr:hypothetical protein M758_5G176800 [Ceratodon purpureus]